MCTVGIKIYNNQKYIFKNLDTKNVNPHYPLPKTNKNVLKFYTPNKRGIWTGINHAGLVIQTAEHKYDPKILKPKCKINTWTIFEEMLECCDDVYAGLIFLMKNFNYARMDIPGTILLSDRKTAIIAEYYPFMWSCSVVEDYAVNAGPFALLKAFNLKQEEGYGREAIARKVLVNAKKGNILQRLKKLCAKHHQADSVCRHSSLNTNCSVIVELSDKIANIHYILNKHPCKSKYDKIAFKLD